MKKNRQKILLVIILFLIVLSAIVIYIHFTPLLKSVDLEEAMQKIEESQDCIIFCTQEYCGGCISVRDSLSSLVKKFDIPVYELSVDPHSVKEYLAQFGLFQTPAIIRVSNDGISIYKENLSKDNLVKIIATNSVNKLRFCDITEVSLTEFQYLENNNNDFLVILGSESCTDCIEFHSLYSEYILNHKNAGLYNLDLDTVKETDSDYYQDILSDYGIIWFPTILHIKNGITIGYYEYPAVKYRSVERESTAEAYSDFLEWIDRELLLP